MIFNRTVRDLVDVYQYSAFISISGLAAGYLMYAGHFNAFLYLTLAFIPIFIVILVFSLKHIDSYRVICDGNELMVTRNNQIWMHKKIADINDICKITHNASADGGVDGISYWKFKRWALVMKDGAVHPFPFAVSGFVAELRSSLTKRSSGASDV